MVLTHASPSRLVFTRKRSLGATVLSAGALAVMGSLPLLAPGPMTSGRAALVLSLFAISALLILLDYRRTERISVALERGAIETSQRSLPLSQARFIALSSTGSTHERAARGRYRAELVMDGSERVILIERVDPAQVLADLRRVLRHWSLPVRSGWGLPETADPWREREATPARAPSEIVTGSGQPFASERGAGWCVLGGFIVIGTAVSLMHGARIRKGADTSALSWTLTTTLLVVVLALSLFLLSDRVVARADSDGLLLERRAFGLRLHGQALPWSRLRGVWAVGVDPNVPQHLLMDLGTELLAFPFAGEAARDFARALPS